MSEAKCAVLAPPGFATSPYLPPSMQRPQPWSIAEFDLNERLYKGDNSRCYSATDKQSGYAVAIKFYRKKRLTKMNRHQVEREVRLHIGLNHPNIIKLHAAFEDDDNVYLVQELATEGDLYRKGSTASSSRYNEHKTINGILVPMLSAVQYLHERGIAHRDLKLENTLLSALGEIKIADFGLAIDTNHERPVTRAGTMDYMAPEILECPDRTEPEENKNRWDLIYTEKVDVWAIGVLTFEILEGKCPFERETRRATMAQILKATVEFPAWMSADAVDFISSALCKEASKRPSPDELLVHPWILGNAGRLGRASSSSGTSKPQLVRSSSSKLAGARRELEETETTTTTTTVQLASSSPLSSSSFTAASAMRSMKAGLGALSSRVAAGRAPPNKAASAVAAAPGGGDGAPRPHPPGRRPSLLLSLANAGQSSSFTAGSSGAGPQRPGFGSSSSTSRFLISSASRQRDDPSGKLLSISAVTRSPTLSRSGSRDGLSLRPSAGVLSDDTQVPVAGSSMMLAMAGVVVGGQEMDLEFGVQRSSQSALVRPYSGSGAGPAAVLGPGRISASSGGAAASERGHSGRQSLSKDDYKYTLVLDRLALPQADDPLCLRKINEASLPTCGSSPSLPVPAVGVLGHSRLSAAGSSPLLLQTGSLSSPYHSAAVAVASVLGHHSSRLSTGGAAGTPFPQQSQQAAAGAFSTPYQCASPKASRASSSIIADAGAALDSRQRGRSSGISASGAPPLPPAHQRSSSLGRSGSFTQARPALAPTAAARDVHHRG